jgi:hypothetical protein
MMLRKIYSVNFKKGAGHRPGICLVLGLILLGTAGCCGETALERDYGQSWAYNEAVQIADPQAPLVETPATGLNPSASANAMNAYNKSFTGKKSGGGSSTTINLGGLTTAGGGGGGGGGDN